MTSEQTATRDLFQPLTADEIRLVVDTLRRCQGVDERWRYTNIELKEPAKHSTAMSPLEAVVDCLNRDSNLMCRAVVNLDDATVTSWNEHPAEQPMLTIDEDSESDAVLRRDPQVAKALAARGITDLDQIHFETWGLGWHDVPERYRGRRVATADVWRLPGAGRNPYANAVSGLHPFIDLNTMEVLGVDDSYAVDEPSIRGEYRPALIDGYRARTDLKPLHVSQPDGPSFTLDGHCLSWQRWSLMIGFTPREGLVLYTVSYQDGEARRSIAHRLSLAEIVSPYRDPSPDHRWRMAYDGGEWGLGMMANSLTLGCDCLGEIRYLDAYVHDSRGEPILKANAVCIHEEDDGLLWKHTDPLDTGAEVRRKRRLVISFHTTIANYDYLVYWRFHQDGSIQCEVQATGIVVTSQFAAGTRPRHGVVVDERTYAPYHQHFIIARLDLDIDGAPNTVHRCELVADPVSAHNPDGMAVADVMTPLCVERDGIQDYSWAGQTTWLITSADKTNRFGTPTGYRLVPHNCVPSMLAADSPALRRAGVMAHDLWVTAYDAQERFPCGDNVVGSANDQGLPKWTQANRPIENTDVVLWHVFGLFHRPRPEDWPVMPVESTSFWLKPASFFDANPALDVAAPAPTQNHHATLSSRCRRT